jgi:polysaccharide deacetylase family protein (PEP-CTERM system associated)
LNKEQLKMMKSAFTIDVECGVNIFMRDFFKAEMPPTERVVDNTKAILQLLKKHNTRATFFVLGDVAKHYPGLIKDIAADEHEIGVHSNDHYQLFKLTKEQAYKDTRIAKDTIENIIGQKVNGYRAPAFSILPQNSWALEMLADNGFSYDSSIMPAKAARYGWPGFSKKMINVQLPGNKSIVEFPLSIYSVLGKEIPACGGGYLKWFPFWFTSKAFNHINKTMPANLYMHPYEIDMVRYPDYYYAEIKKLSLLRQVKMSLLQVNKSTVHSKLDRLLQNFSFDTMQNIIDDYNSKGLIESAPLQNFLS